MKGKTPVISEGIEGIYLRILKEYCVRYRIGFGRMFIEVLGAYSQNLAEALHENISMPRGEILAYINVVATACEQFAKYQEASVPFSTYAHMLCVR